MSNTLRLACPTSILQSRMKMGLRPWQIHKSRFVTRCLHKIRSGRNRLNRTFRYFDAGNDGTYPNDGCNALEDVDNVLVICPFYEHNRILLKNLITNLNLEFSAPVLLGICENIDPNSFSFNSSKKTGLINRI